MMSRRIFTTWLAGVCVLAASTISYPRSIGAQQEDLRCTTLASLARFTVVSTKDTARSDLYLGADSTVGTTDVAGICSLTSGTCECPKLRCSSEGERCDADSDCTDGVCGGGVCACAPLSCAIAGQRCIGDGDCLVAAPGRCDPQTHSCSCPASAPGCLARARQCASDSDCAVPSQLIGHSIGGVCGNDMLITAGSRMGLLASRGDVDFGSTQPRCRILRIESEFANTANGRVKMAQHAPFLGPASRRSDGSAACAPNSRCDADCATGRQLVLGRGASSFSSFDGQARRGLAGTGSSLNFKLCDAALTLLESTGNDSEFGPSPFQSAIESYLPLASERVALGASNCLACPLVTSSDRGCEACAAADVIRTRARAKKIVITLGSGLQVLDLQEVALQGNSVLELRGQRDTVALIRVARGLRLGPETKVLLESNGTGNGTLQVDKVLWVAMGGKGGRPNLWHASTFRGTLLASGRVGIRLGGAVLVEGALWSRKVSVGVQSTVQHYPFSELLPLPGSGAEVFAPVGSELRACADAILSAPK